MLKRLLFVGAGAAFCLYTLDAVYRAYTKEDLNITWDRMVMSDVTLAAVSLILMVWMKNEGWDRVQT